MNAKEKELAQLTQGITDFAKNQDAQALDVSEKAAAQSAGLELLTRQTEEALTKLDQALLGIDTKLVNAVEECKTGVVSEIDALRNQMYTYSVGAKAEINEIIGVLKSGKGADAKGAGGFGKGFGGDMGNGLRHRVWQGRRPQRGRGLEAARRCLQDPVQALYDRRGFVA